MRPILSHGASGVAFVVKEDFQLDELISDCEITAELSLDGEHQERINKRHFKALWDTGATNSMITERVVKECNLIPTGMTIVNGINGSHQTNTYIVGIILSGLVYFPAVRVTKGNFSGADVLIGMDIIGSGDFAVTNKDGQTSFMFRCPSEGGIDFLNEEGWDAEE